MENRYSFSCTSDESGQVYVQCCLEDGSYLIFIDNCDLDTSNIYSTNIFSISKIENSISQIRLTHVNINNTENELENRLFLTCDNVGNVGLAHLVPLSNVNIKIIDSSSSELIMDVYNFQKDKNEELQQEIDVLKSKIFELENMIEKIYFSPGMPGYFESKESFESKQFE